MPIEKPIYQLMLPLEGVEEAVQENEHLSVEEVRSRSEAALSTLAALRLKDPQTGIESAPRWMDLFKRLHDGGWPWRVSVYIAWASQPKKYRWPVSQELLATTCLGLTSDRAISTWRKRNPAIDNTVGMLQGALIFDALPDAYDAMITVATVADYKGHNDRKLMFEMAGVYTPRISAELRRRGLTADDLAEMSDEELEAIALAAGKNFTTTPHNNAGQADTKNTKENLEIGKEDASRSTQIPTGSRQRDFDDAAGSRSSRDTDEPEVEK
jgi:hypothetical protein